MVLLTVPGRKSGLPRTTPIAINQHPDGWTVIAPYGHVDWVRNLQASGRATLTRRGRRFDVTATQLPVPVAGPLLVESLRTASSAAKKRILPHFETPLDAPAEAWEMEATRHPVFLLRPVHRK